MTKSTFLEKIQKFVIAHAWLKKFANKNYNQDMCKNWHSFKTKSIKNLAGLLKYYKKL